MRNSLFIIGLSFFTVHEMDAVRCKEWRIFPGLSLLSNKMGTWKNSGFHETEDLLEFKVTSCANVELFEAIDCPELNTLGCDIDLAGYPLIEEAVQCEFRRPFTIAKGGEYCHFHFHRKDTAPNTAPNTAHLNHNT